MFSLKTKTKHPIFLKTNSYSVIVSDPNVIKNCVFEIHKFHVNCSQSKTTSDSWSLFSLLFWNLHEKLHTSQLRKLVVLQGRLDRSRFGATPWGLCFSFFFSSNIKILWKKKKIYIYIYIYAYIAQWTYYNPVLSASSREDEKALVQDVASLQSTSLSFPLPHYPQRISFRHLPRRLCRT